MYFLRGSLPWQGQKAVTNKAKYEKIGEKKQTTLISELCHGFPEEFAEYLKYSRSLEFEQTPDYDYMISLFDRILMNLNQVDDGVFDWMIEMERQLKERQAKRYLKEIQKVPEQKTDAGFDYSTTKTINTSIHNHLDNTLGRQTLTRRDTSGGSPLMKAEEKVIPEKKKKNMFGKMKKWLHNVFFK